MTQTDFAQICTSCALADRSCPSYPHPVDHCQQYRPHPEARRWWESLHPDAEPGEGQDGD